MFTNLTLVNRDRKFELVAIIGFTTAVPDTREEYMLPIRFCNVKIDSMERYNLLETIITLCNKHINDYDTTRLSLLKMWTGFTYEDAMRTASLDLFQRVMLRSCKTYSDVNRLVDHNAFSEDSEEDLFSMDAYVRELEAQRNHTVFDPDMFYIFESWSPEHAAQELTLRKMFDSLNGSATLTDNLKLRSQRIRFEHELDKRIAAANATKRKWGKHGRLESTNTAAE